MRTTFNTVLDRKISAIGFGCASLGSRVAPADGIRSLEYAYELGVNWYDVAPPYGDGDAEAILGSFLKGRRDRVVVCTKVGITRPNISAFKKLLRHPARWMVKTIPGIRGHISRARPVGSRPPLEPKEIRASVEASLRLLKIDYLDVLALHEPTVDDCNNSEIIEAMHRIRKDGLARVISIAGAPESVCAGLSNSSEFRGLNFKTVLFLKTFGASERRMGRESPFYRNSQRT